MRRGGPVKEMRLSRHDDGEWEARGRKTMKNFVIKRILERAGLIGDRKMSRNMGVIWVNLPH